MENNLLKIKIVVICFLLALPFAVNAKAPWQYNKVREKRKQDAIWAEASQIPLLKEKVKDRKYQILGFVRGEDLFTSKHIAIYNKMRLDAHKMGADAIMEVRCKRIMKSFAQQCEGFAIKYLDSPHANQVPEELEP